jgi:hypothetical protein
VIFLSSFRVFIHIGGVYCLGEAGGNYTGLAWQWHGTVQYFNSTPPFSLCL